MTYVVTEACIKCKFMDCVEVCPVDCFYEGENMLVIHPDECIDCGVCEPECPPEAIKADTESGLEKWLSVNAEYAKTWPNITQKGEAPADAKEWEGVAGQVREIFQPQAGFGLLGPPAGPAQSINCHPFPGPVPEFGTMDQALALTGVFNEFEINLHIFNSLGRFSFQFAVKL